MSVFKSFVAGVTVFLVIVAGCSSPPADPVSISAASTADLTATALCVISTDAARGVLAYAMFGTPTPRPGSTATPTLQPGNPARGEVVFNDAGSCNACHSVADDTAWVGPSLRQVALRAPYRRPEMSAEDYLRGVILRPEETINPLTKPGIMPRSYEQSLTVEQINDLVAYLMTLD